MSSAPRVVAICGPTGAGKTTLAKALAEKYSAPLISLDEFMRPTKDVLKHDTSILCKLAEPLHKLHEFSHNYEHPSCIDWERFSKRVEELKSSTKNSGKFNFIIIEGHLLLSNRDMWPLFSKSISLTPRLSPSASESLARRRWSRDYKQTCTMEHFRQYWNAVIWPSYLEHGSSVPPNTLLISTDLPHETALQMATRYLAEE